MVATPCGPSSDRWTSAEGWLGSRPVNQTTELLLRPFRLEDAPAVGPWFHGPGLALPPGQAGREWAARMLADQRIVTWIAQIGGQRVGFARLDIGPDRIAELTLVVAPAHRGVGVGRSILSLVLLEALRRGVRRLSAVVDQANTGAHKFFLENGFEDTPCEVGGPIRMLRLVHRHASGEPLEIEL